MSIGDVIVLCSVIIAGIVLCLAPRIMDKSTNKNDWTEL
jgi:hypothetical protein